jgi:hypothetical protein
MNSNSYSTFPGTTMQTYEVLYNAAIGDCITIPLDVCKDIFRQFPPRTPVGNKLFRKTRSDLFVKPGDPVQPDTSFYQINGYKDFCDGYQQIIISTIHGKKYVVTKSFYVTDGSNYYKLQQDVTNEWRSLPEIIQLVKERGYIGKKCKEDETTLQIAQVPVGYAFHVEICDGYESVQTVCPTDEIISDLLSVIHNNSDCKKPLNPVTQKLLDGADLKSVIHPNLKNTQQNT